MNRVVVITGASSGIGEQLKQFYQKNGDIVINLSIDVKEEDNYNFKLDVSKNEDVANVFDKVGKLYKKIDVLINCAGYGVFGAVELLADEKCKQIFDVNFFGTLWCCKNALKYMERGARIINISSICALFAIPFRTMYSASKAAVSMLSFGLGMELKEFGISVTAICPGDIKTNFSKNRDITLQTNNKYGERIQRSCDIIASKENKRMDKVKASKKIYDICNKKHLKPMYIIGSKYKVFNFARRVLSQKQLNSYINNKY